MRSHHRSASNEVAHICFDVRNIGMIKAYDIYGIQFIRDEIEGPIFDPVYNREFNNVTEWASFNVEQEQYEEETNEFGYEFEDDEKF